MVTSMLKLLSSWIVSCRFHLQKMLMSKLKLVGSWMASCMFHLQKLFSEAPQSQPDSNYSCPAMAMVNCH